MPEATNRKVADVGLRASTVLQKLVFPAVGTADRTTLYARWLDGAITLCQENGEWTLPPGTRIELSTYFNSFSRAKWCALASLSDLRFRLNGTGTIQVRINAFTSTGAAICVADGLFQLDGQDEELEIVDVRAMPGTMLAAELITRDRHCTLRQAEWVTRDAPKRNVSLAVILTTFRRERQALRVIEKFTSAVVPGVPTTYVHLYVIDNGATLQGVTSNHVTYIKNRNLGGAGGFSRGLIEARAAQRFTHVLFMDDDTWWEPESIWRTIALAQQVDDPTIAIAGTMFLADRQLVQYEKGARLSVAGNVDEVLHAHHSIMDLSDLVHLCGNDRFAFDNINYGGFWFLAVSISEAKYFPFPFFVRGDDVDFCLSNKLKIVTMNGIASWCESFAYKLSPASEYLAVRAVFALVLMHGDKSAAKSVIKHFIGGAFDFGQRFDYAGMQATLDALEDVTKGPRFFSEGPAPMERLEAMKRRTDSRAPTADDLRNTEEIDWGRRRRRQIAAWLTIASLFIPKCFIRPTYTHRMSAYEVGRWNVLQYSGTIFGRSTEILLYKRDQGKWRAGIWRLLKVRWKVGRQLDELLKAYKFDMAKYRSEAFWRRALGLPPLR